VTFTIIQTAFLGDVLLGLPVCVALRRAFPDARIVLVTTPAAASFVDGIGVVDAVVAFDKRGAHASASARAALASQLRVPGEHTLIVPHTSVRTMMLVRAIGAERVITFTTAATRWVATDVVPYPQHRHDADRQLALLGPVLAHVPSAHDLVPIRITTDDDVARVAARLPQGGYVALAPGSAWPTKQWPAASFAALADRLTSDGVNVVVVGDASGIHAVPERPGVVNLCGTTTLREAAAVLARANVVVSNDSAPVHLASLQRVPVVAIFGPTVPEFGFAPFGPHVAVVQQGAMRCRPCSPHGTAACPLGTHACMTSITADDVHASIRTLLHAHDENRHASTHQANNDHNDV
jgi:heptosyltransferase-2